MKETSFIAHPINETRHNSSVSGRDEEQQTSDHTRCGCGFSGWITRHPKTTLATLFGLASAGGVAYALVHTLANRSTAVVSPSNNVLLPNRIAGSNVLPGQTLSPTTSSFIENSISALPVSVRASPSAVPDWYKAITSSETSVPSSTELPSSQTISPAATGLIGNSITALPESVTTSPSTVTDWHQETTVLSTNGKPISGEKLVDRPFAEYEKTGYLIFNDLDFNSYKGRYFESMRIKKKIMKNLPKGVQLVVYTSDRSVHKVRNIFKPYINEKRLHVVQIKDGSYKEFWARDSIPIPVYGKKNHLALVDAVYDRTASRFEPDQDIADFFNATLLSHPYEFEGGNFLADSHGNCFTVNKDVMVREGMGDHVFKTYYGCNRITRLKQMTAVGHVDEVIKIIDSYNILTDQPSYRPILENLGYNVTMMPKVEGIYGNYLNAAIINRKVFVPVYGLNRTADKLAMKIYRSFGLRAYSVQSREISDNMQGSIHCMTMTYPKLDTIKLIKPAV